MMTTPAVDHDERTTAVQNASYRYGYIFAMFAVLVAAAYRSFVYGQPTWDLLGIVIASGVLVTIYQYHAQAVQRSTVRRGGLSAIVAAAIAVIFGLLLTRR